MKKLLSFMLVIAMMLTLTLSFAETETTLPRVVALKGPTAMGLTKMMTDEAAGYDFHVVGAVDEISPLLIKGEVDIAAVPANLASVLYNKTEGKVQVLAVNTMGVLYIVENGDTIHSVQDLKGKTIYTSGKGATPEYALNFILTANGIDPATDVTIDFRSEHTECLTALLSNEGSVAMLPQPFLTTAMMKQEGIRMALDLNTEWAALQEGQENQSALITGVMVVRTEFAQQNPEAVAAFMNSYSASVDFVNANPEEASKLIAAFDIVPEPVALKALPYCQIVYIDGAEMKEMLSGYLQVLFDQNPQAVGGSLPGDAFYYEK